MASVVSSSASLYISNLIRLQQDQMDQSLLRLASGKRVTSPKDDVGAYFLGTDFSRRATQVDMVAQQLEDNLSALSTTKDALSEIENLLEEASELALQASTEDDDNTRDTLATEFQLLMDQVDNIVSTTDFKGTALIDGDSTHTIQMDEDPGDTLSYTIYDTRRENANGLNLDAPYNDPSGDWGGGVADAAAKAAAADYYAALQGTRPDNSEASGLAIIDRNLTRIASLESILEGRQTTLQNKAANYEAAASTLLDVNDAKETTLLTSTQIRQQAGAFFLTQANNQNANVMALFFK